MAPFEEYPVIRRETRGIGPATAGIQSFFMSTIKQHRTDSPSSGQPASLLPFQDPHLPVRQRVDDLVSRLTLEEKIGLIPTNQEGVERLGVGEYFVGGEAAHGFQAREGTSTVFPQTIGLSQTWDEALMEEIGTAVGTEARAWYYKRQKTGGLTPWAPTVDMERDPRWGRNEEAYGEDPVLAAALAGAYVRGMQGPHDYYLRCAPALKHFYANNNEELRGSWSASIDEINAREYYRKVYELIVRHAKVHSFMTAYNAVNGVPAMLHPDIDTVVRGEWDFDGYIVCDGAAFRLLMYEHKWITDPAQAIAATLKAGIDCVTDEPDLVKDSVRSALKTGLLGETDIDRAISRVLAIRTRLGQFDPPGSDPYENIPITAINRKEHRALARRAAEKSIVLLKNQDSILPLAEKSCGTVAVVGPLASVFYRDWYAGNPPYTVTPQDALSDRLGPERIRVADGDDLVTLRYEGKAVAIRSWDDSRLNLARERNPVMAQYKLRDWGWGNNTLRNLVNGQYVSTDDKILSASAAEVWGWFVRERLEFTDKGEAGFGIRTWKGGRVVADSDNFIKIETPVSANTPNSDADNGNADSTGKAENSNSRKKTGPGTFSLDLITDGVSQAAEYAAASDTALVFVGNHPLLVARETIDRPELGLPPRQADLVRAVAAANPRTVLVIVGGYPYDIGDLLPLVKALIFVPMAGQEAGNAVSSALFGDHSPAGRLSMTWYESLKQLPDIFDYDTIRGGRTYRYFKDKVLFPFGFGLSYASFAYQVQNTGESRFTAPQWDAKTHTWKNDPQIKLAVKVRNTSTVDSDEVVQVYVKGSGSLWRSERELVWFRRVAVKAGATVETEARIALSLLARWDTAHKGWNIESGDYTVHIGASSADIRAELSIHVDGHSLEARNPFVYAHAPDFDECSPFSSGLHIAADSERRFHVTVRDPALRKIEVRRHPADADAHKTDNTYKTGSGTRANPPAWTCYKGFAFPRDKVKNLSVEVSFAQNAGGEAARERGKAAGSKAAAPGVAASKDAAPDRSARVEFRLGSPAGELLCTVEEAIPSNRGTVPASALPELGAGVCDLYLVFHGDVRVEGFVFR